MLPTLFRISHLRHEHVDLLALEGPLLVEPGGVVLDDGRIVEEGTHDGLLARNGLYARYWNRQSGGFIGVDDKEAAE